MRDIAPWFGLAALEPAAREVVVVGCPFDDSASGRSGSSEGPAEIRSWARSAEAITEDGRTIEELRVVDRGDVEAETGAGFDRSAAIASAARAALDAHPAAFILGIGGDHAVTPPLVRAVAEADGPIGFLMLDAHADCFDSYEGDRDSHACTVARCWDEGGIEPARTALVGLRSYALPELEAIGRAGSWMSAAEWARVGTAEVARRIAETIGDLPLYLSLDIDVLDAAHAPGTGYPVAGGPDPRALLDLLPALWRRQRVVAMDLVEVAPGLDPAGITPATAAHVLLQVFGHVARA